MRTYFKRKIFWVIFVKEYLNLDQNSFRILLSKVMEIWEPDVVSVQVWWLWFDSPSMKAINNLYCIKGSVRILGWRSSCLVQMRDTVNVHLRSTLRVEFFSLYNQQNSIVIGNKMGNLLSCIFPGPSLDFSWDLWKRVKGFNWGLVGKKLICACFRETGWDQKKPFLGPTVLSFGLNE